MSNLGDTRSNSNDQHPNNHNTNQMSTTDPLRGGMNYRRRLKKVNNKGPNEAKRLFGPLWNGWNIQGDYLNSVTLKKCKKSKLGHYESSKEELNAAIENAKDRKKVCLSLFTEEDLEVFFKEVRTDSGRKEVTQGLIHFSHTMINHVLAHLSEEASELITCLFIDYYDARCEKHRQDGQYDLTDCHDGDDRWEEVGGFGAEEIATLKYLAKLFGRTIENIWHAVMQNQNKFKIESVLSQLKSPEETIQYLNRKHPGLWYRIYNRVWADANKRFNMAMDVDDDDDQRDDSNNSHRVENSKKGRSGRSKRSKDPMSQSSGGGEFDHDEQLINNMTKEYCNNRKDDEDRVDDAVAGFIADREKGDQESSTSILFKRFQSLTKMGEGIWGIHMIKLLTDSLNELVGQRAYNRASMVNKVLQKINDGGNSTEWSNTRVLYVTEMIKNPNVNSEATKGLIKKLLEESKRRLAAGTNPPQYHLMNQYADANTAMDVDEGQFRTDHRFGELRVILFKILNPQSNGTEMEVDSAYKFQMETLNQAMKAADEGLNVNVNQIYTEAIAC